MAFEIYNGVGDFANALAKINEMWELDSYDSSTNQATYGIATMDGGANAIVIRAESSSVFNADFGYSTSYTIVKSAAAILLTWIYGNSSSSVGVLVLGTTTDEDGVTGKGLACKGGTYSLKYMTTRVQAEYSDFTLTSDGNNQLINLSSNTYSTHTFDSVYRLAIKSFVNPNATRGKFTLKGDTYYIANYLAIKEE
jgi:hypothetical protein